MHIAETRTREVSGMHPDLHLLLQLQGIDYDIGELERSKEYMPDMMGSLKEEIDKASSAYNDAKQELSDLKVRQKTCEVELGSMQDDLKRYQSQMMSIKTNKEYDALVHEIDSIKNRISEKETEIISAQERIEELEGSMESLESNSKQLTETNTQQLDSLKNRIDSVGEKIQEREHERQKLVKDISRQSLSIYERVRRGKGASVVVAVRKGACSGCFKTVPPQRMQEIRRGARVVVCDNCGRMLMPEDDNGSEA